MSAVRVAEIDDQDGAHDTAEEEAGDPDENGTVRGSLLRNLTAMWEDVQRTRLAAEQRNLPALAIEMKRQEDRLGRMVKREIERHPIWPWLAQYPGLGGVHTARLVALIGDPHRFPGRVCGAGHHHSAADRAAEIVKSDGCGYELADGTACAAPIGPVRRGAGVRSLWHYLGLHVVDGRSPRRRKGQKADWNPTGRTAVLMPGGIADQIVRLKVPHYRDVYDTTKERLSRERADGRIESDMTHGPLPIHLVEAERCAESEQVDGLHPIQQAEAGDGRESDHDAGLRSGTQRADTPTESEAVAGPLRPFQIDAIARKVAAKRFVGDLLTEWKRLTG